MNSDLVSINGTFFTLWLARNISGIHLKIGSQDMEVLTAAASYSICPFRRLSCISLQLHASRLFCYKRPFKELLANKNFSRSSLLVAAAQTVWMSRLNSFLLLDKLIYLCPSALWAWKMLANFQSAYSVCEASVKRARQTTWAIRQAAVRSCDRWTEKSIAKAGEWTQNDSEIPRMDSKKIVRPCKADLLLYSFQCFSRHFWASTSMFKVCRVFACT